jgi:hypothetical protein
VEVSGKVWRLDGYTKRVICGGEQPPVARRRVLGRKISFSRNTNLSTSISRPVSGEVHRGAHIETTQTRQPYSLTSSTTHAGARPICWPGNIPVVCLRYIHLCSRQALPAPASGRPASHACGWEKATQQEAKNQPQRLWERQDKGLDQCRDVDRLPQLPWTTRCVHFHAAFRHCRLRSLRPSAERLEKGHAAGDRTRSPGKI